MGIHGAISCNFQARTGSHCEFDLCLVDPHAQPITFRSTLWVKIIVASKTGRSDTIHFFPSFLPVGTPIFDPYSGGYQSNCQNFSWESHVAKNGDEILGFCFFPCFQIHQTGRNSEPPSRLLPWRVPKIWDPVMVCWDHQPLSCCPSTSWDGIGIAICLSGYLSIYLFQSIPIYSNLSQSIPIYSNLYIPIEVFYIF